VQLSGFPTLQLWHSYPNETDGIAYECRGILFPLHTIQNLVAVTPICNPKDFLARSRDKTWQPQLGHATVHNGLDNLSLFLESHRIERHGIRPPVRQWRQMRKPFWIVQDAHDPEMIEEASC
jgi:hypothetical protein